MGVPVMTLEQANKAKAMIEKKKTVAPTNTPSPNSGTESQQPVRSRRESIKLGEERRTKKRRTLLGNSRSNLLGG